MRHVLEIGCLITGILCLFYYVGIVLYAGITTSFAWVWLFGGAVMILLRIALWYQKLHPYLWLRCLTGAAFALIAAALVIILATGSRIIGAMRTVPQQDLDYVIVLGAQVRGTSPSLSLKKRLERAAEYAKENPDTIFILSGGQGADEDISEAECMYHYLVDAGVSGERLLMEDASTSTRENLIFSAEIIRGLDTDELHSLGVLSNDFHIYRALLLAEETGYTNASGIPAESVPVMQPHNILREICAVLAMQLF